MPIPIETDRLILRPFLVDDIQSLAQYRSDPEVAKYQGWDLPYAEEQAAELVSEMMALTPGDPGQWYQIAIQLKKTGQLIGDCAFRRLSKDHAQAEIGFTIARPHQGQGYATEALIALLSYVFDELEVHRVYANCDPDNLPSIRLLQKMGLRHEGRFIESLWLRGSWVSEDWYAILRREWKEQHY